MPTSSSAPTRPRISRSPSVGSVIRERIFSSVLLPAPLRPMMPTHLARLRRRTRRRRAPRSRPRATRARAAGGASRRRRRERLAERPAVGDVLRRGDSASPDRVDRDRSAIRPRPRTSARCAGSSRTPRTSSDERDRRRTGRRCQIEASSAEQRPAEALDHADHRIQAVDAAPGSGTRVLRSRRSAWRTARSAIRNGTM